MGSQSCPALTVGLGRRPCALVDRVMHPPVGVHLFTGSGMFVPWAWCRQCGRWGVGMELRGYAEGKGKGQAWPWRSPISLVARNRPEVWGLSGVAGDPISVKFHREYGVGGFVFVVHLQSLMLVRDWSIHASSGRRVRITPIASRRTARPGSFRGTFPSWTALATIFSWLPC